MSNADRIIQVAKAEVGYHEGRANGHWNNKQKYSPAVPSLEWSNYQAWCATFVSWCAQEANVKGLYPVTASTDLGASWFKSKGQWSEYPAIGAQVFYGHNGDMNHTGIVYNYDANYIYTVEGNTNSSGSREGDGVYLKKRARRDDYVQGYGYPKFTDGIVSADPNPPVKRRGKKAPKKATAHTRWALRETGVYENPAGKLVRKVKPGESFKVIDGSGRNGWVETTHHHYVISNHTTKDKKEAATVTGEQPNFQTRMIESNTRIEEMLRAIGAATGANIKGALERADKTNKNRKG